MVGLIFNLVLDEARKVWRYRQLLAATAALIFVAAGVYIFSIPKTYESWGQIYTPKETPVTLAADGVSMGDLVDLNVVKRALLNDDTLAKVVGQLNPDAANLDRQQMESAASGLRGQISIESDDEGFIEFRVKDGDPVRAQKITHLVMNQFVSESVDRSRRNLGQASAFLDEQIASYEKLLVQSQTEMTAFRSRHPGATVAAAATVGDGGAELAAARSLYASAARTSGASARAAAPQDATIAELEGRLATLLTQYTEQYPDVVATRREIASLKAQRSAYLATAPAAAASANPALAEARARLAAAQASARSSRPGVAAPTATAEWIELQRKHERLTKTYEELVGRRDSARMAQAVNTSGASGKFQVMHAPTVPRGPAGPNRVLYLTLAAAFALAVGVGVAYARAAITGIFVSARAVEDAFQLPVIGTVSWESAWHIQKTGRSRLALGHSKQRSLPAN
jgi:polysaccharide chain length determinant protein (PEP-CTERM system associated)